MPGRAKTNSDLERARAAYAARAWNDAFVALARVDDRAPLAPEDLERLAWSAALTGRDDDYVRAMERVYQARFDDGAELAAARAAFWIGLRLRIVGEHGRASGWLSRAQRLVEGKDCAEAGYLLLPEIRRHDMADELDQMLALAERAAEIGDRFREPDLSAFARALAGKAAVRQGRTDAGLTLLDEAMLAVTGDRVLPIFTGLIYCIMIATCHQVYALERAREWTAALAAWCEAQSQLVTFTGTCAVHRVEILQIGGAWGEAIEAARATASRYAAASGRDAHEAAGDAFYQQAEIHRLRGEHAEAEASYRAASEHGREPQPGLALLRLTQGRIADAASAIRRVLAATPEPLRRIRYLPATVEILVAADDIDDARAAVADLENVAASYKTEILAAMVAHAHAVIAVAERRPQAAIEPLRRAMRVWQDVGAPYIVARIRVLLARACAAAGDDDAAAIELDLARKAFADLGAAPDALGLDGGKSTSTPALPNGLSPRELEVLRLIATGKTNKAIARELHLSEKTIDRHVSNIFVKANVASRAAATAYAYQQRLV